MLLQLRPRLQSAIVQVRGVVSLRGVGLSRGWGGCLLRSLVWLQRGPRLPCGVVLIVAGSPLVGIFERLWCLHYLN